MYVAEPADVELSGENPYANAPPTMSNVVPVNGKPATGIAEPLMWLVFESAPAVVTGGALLVVRVGVASAGAFTRKPDGPVIVGVLSSVADRPLDCRNVTTVFSPVEVPKMLAVPTAN